MALGQRCAWEPQRVELLAGGRIKQVACGFDHTLVLAEDGTLFSFGDNSLCQLGRPSRPQVRRRRPGRDAVADGSAHIAPGLQGEHLQPDCATAWIVNPESASEKRIRFSKARTIHISTSSCPVNAVACLPHQPADSEPMCHTPDRWRRGWGTAWACWPTAAS